MGENVGRLIGTSPDRKDCRATEAITSHNRRGAPENTNGPEYEQSRSRRF